MTATPVGTCTQAPWPRSRPSYVPTTACSVTYIAVYSLMLSSRVLPNRDTYHSRSQQPVCSDSFGIWCIAAAASHLQMARKDTGSGRVVCVWGRIVQLRRPNIWCALAKSCPLNNSQECSPFSVLIFCETRRAHSEPQAACEASRKA